MTSGARATGSAVFLTLMVCLAAGAVIETLRNWSDWRLGFSPPVWEIAVGWVGFSALSAIAACGFILGGVGFYSAHVRTNRAHSYAAKERLIEVKYKAALALIGAGMLAVFGGLVLWIYGNMGPEFEAYVGLARMATLLGLAAGAGAYFYANQEHDS
ncbi:MAG: hypothetical protein WD602_04465 [Actinomycetota bacterium]